MRLALQPARRDANTVCRIKARHSDASARLFGLATPNLWGVGMTGLIFGVIVIAWLAYLLPWTLNSRSHSPLADEGSFFGLASSMKVIRRGSDPFGDQNDPGLELSTPLQRNAARYEIRRSARTAARRRRAGLLVHLSAVIAGLVVFLVWRTPLLWSVVLPTVLLLGFLALARVSVSTLNRALDEKKAWISFGDQEDTVCVVLPDLGEGSAELSVELSGPLDEGIASLWEPIPVTPATYVSTPMLPRSVRTIDLSAPVAPAATPALPPTAEAPQPRHVDDEQASLAESAWRKAVGE